jgi:prepilin signal peptidase PulO-like enzyme (type II secretory pathway)
MRTVVAIVADLAIAFCIWAVSDRLPTIPLLIAIIVAFVMIAALTSNVASSMARSVEDGPKRATADDVRR